MSADAATMSPVETPFAPLFNLTGMQGMRSSLDAASNSGMVAFYVFLMMDRDQMVEAIKSVHEASGGDEAMGILEVLAAVRDNLEEITRYARIVEARAILTMHKALDIPWESEPDATALWDQAVAAEAAAKAVMEATPVGSANDDEVVDAWADAGDHLIEGVIAPTHEVLATKMRYAFARYDGFVLPDECQEALLRDVAALGEAAK
jgi:hypothetical protein